MSRFLRLAFAWMLAVALPLQAYAAHAMLACGPAHHAAAIPHADLQGMHHHGLDASSIEAALDHQHVELADDGGGAATGEVAKSQGHAGKCSVCASCCNAAAIITRVFHLEPSPAKPLSVPTVIAAHDSIPADGLERPPRG